MKRLIVISLLLAVALFPPIAEAQSCSPYLCRVGNCPYWELLADTAFTTPSCGAWSYTGGASLQNGAICNWTNTAFGQLTYTGGLLHVSTIQQTVATRNTGNDLDSFNFQYIMEIDNMTAGDTVKVQITDTTTGVTLTTDTFTSDTWCNSVSHSYSGKGWLGHSLRVKFTGTFANTGTTAKVTNVTLWQQYTP